MDILVLSLIVILSFSAVVTLLNENVKATISLLAPVPALAYFSQFLGIGGMYQFISCCCVALLVFELLVVKQLFEDRKVEVPFYVLALGYVAAIYSCHTFMGLGIRQSVMTASCHYIYVFNLAFLLIYKHKRALPSASYVTAD